MKAARVSILLGASWHRHVWGPNARFVTPLLVGLLITFAGAIWLVRTAVFIMGAAEAPGVITKIEPSRNSGSAWDLTFTFSDAEGMVHTAQTWFMSLNTRPAIKAGDGVTVIYDRSAPKHAEVDSFATLWLAPVSFLGLGLFFVGGGYVILLAGRLTSRYQREQMTAEREKGSEVVSG
jgi:hypothetical protein